MTRVSLFFSVLVLVLGFFSRKILIDCLGCGSLKDLNTTATNLLGFLNLAELGISADYFIHIIYSSVSEGL